MNKLKVVELASILAGPAVGTFFAEMGAKVIKVENKNTGGDITRSWKTPTEDKDAKVSAYYASANWGKEVIMADLRNPADRQEVIELIKDADIVITNFKAGADKKLGMDYETIKKINQKIIYASINGYGEGNPRPAFDALLQAETGFMSMNGTEESGPIKMPVALIDILAAHQLKEGILTALLQRQNTNTGSRVSVSLFDTAIASLANQAGNWIMTGHLPGRMGSLHPNIAPYGDLFQTRDQRKIMLAVGTDEQFRTLCHLLGKDELADDLRLSSNAERVRNRAFLQESLAGPFSKSDADDLLEKLEKNNIPAGAIRNLKEVFELPEAQKLIIDEEIDGVNTRRVKTTVFQLNATHPDSPEK